jgi:prephenate dehydrogenase
MAKTKITIIGLGLVGCSIGKGLCQGAREYEVVGHDREPAAAAAARKAHAVDRTEWNLISAVAGADLIILALPGQAIRATMEAMAQDLKPGCIVTDTASVKAPILRWAAELLPNTVHFVGGDPILNDPGGASGADGATADLLRGAVYCLCPASATAPEAVRVVADLAERLGARPLFLDAAEHDGLIAGVDQLPALLAAALISATALTGPWHEMRKLAGSQYAASTQILATDPATCSDAILANSENSIRWLDLYIAALQRWRQLIAEGEGETLAKEIRKVMDAHAAWLHQRASGRWEEGEGVDLSEVGGSWRSLFGLRPRPPERRERQP